MIALTPREYDALRAYCEKGDRAQAAHSLGIAKNTLVVQLAAVYAKSDAQSALEALWRRGWIAPPARPVAIPARVEGLFCGDGSELGGRHPSDPTDEGPR